MLIYFKKKLEPIRLYDIINDPREFKNIIKDKSLRKEVETMIDYLKKYEVTFLIKYNEPYLRIINQLL